MGRFFFFFSFRSIIFKRTLFNSLNKRETPLWFPQRQFSDIYLKSYLCLEYFLMPDAIIFPLLPPVISFYTNASESTSESIRNHLSIGLVCSHTEEESTGGRMSGAQKQTSEKSETLKRQKTQYNIMIFFQFIQFISLVLHLLPSSSYLCQLLVVRIIPFMLCIQFLAFNRET